MTKQEAIEIIRERIREDELVEWVARNTKIPDGLDENGEGWFEEAKG